ncbi:MAG: glycosyltransferase, partial [Cyanobacteria bacterium J06649_4]
MLFESLIDVTPVLYLSILSVISLYGFHKVWTLWRFYKCSAVTAKALPFSKDQLPKVTVQLPIFNELYVAERLLDAIAQLNYPPDKLEIQVLDDSTDETRSLCQEKVKSLQPQLNIHYIQRPHRRGFKAGALDYGLQQATGELIMIFDADFVPR